MFIQLLFLSLTKLKIEIMTRLQSLRHRKEILINANDVNQYTRTSHPKMEQYYRLMIDIRKEINAIECVNVRPAKALVGMSVKQLFELHKN